MVCLSRSSKGSGQCGGLHSHCGGEGSIQLHSHCGAARAATSFIRTAAAALVAAAAVCLSRSSEGSRQVHSHCGGEGSNQLHSHCGGCLGCGSCGLSEQSRQVHSHCG